MTLSPEIVLKQLDQEEIIDWPAELKNGKEPYKFLVEALTGRNLNVNQLRNALHALFRIRRHGSIPEVLQKFIEFAGHPNGDIRSEAVQLAIGLVRFSRMTDSAPIMLSNQQEERIREAAA